MERVVYLLGAGFSAPLGLPVMSNFRMKSEDMYSSDRERYKHFKSVFAAIKEMSVSKNYYETNLFNIEEILSILEMGEYLEGKRLKKNFLQYISDVIKYYTPEIIPHAKGSLPGNWTDWLFGEDTKWHPYGMFVASILNLRFLPQGQSLRGYYSDILCASNHMPQVRYSIVTLNYDLIPEKVCEFINSNYSVEGKVSFVDTITDELYPTIFDGRFTASLSKLHGSIDTGEIIPPTWSKGVNRKVSSAWKLAYQLLADATQLRIIGYSLPTADAYVKYLLKSAVIQDPHLKKIDVICRDSDGSVEKRYKKFIKFDYYSFINGDVTKYLENHRAMYRDAFGRNDLLTNGFIINKLEEAHEKFVNP